MKKYMKIAALSMLAASANAEYMGISSLATTENFNPVIISTALRNGDEIMIENWKKEKKLSTPYLPEEGICKVQGAHNLMNDKVYDDKTYKNWINSLGIANSYTIHSKCESLWLLQSLSELRDLKNGISVHHIFKNKNNSKDLIRQKYALEIIDNLEPNQWDQLLPVITYNSFDLKIRLNALRKFEELYPKRMETANSKQKLYWEAATHLTNERLSASNQYLQVLNPTEYLYRTLLEQFLNISQAVANEKDYPSKDFFNKDFWLNKKNVSFEEVAKSGRKPVNTLRYIRAYNQAVLLKEIMKMKDFNKNYQDANGETALHEIFKSRNVNSLTDNKVLADFIRAQLESGFNPMLLNKSNESTYMKFEKIKAHKGGGDKTQQLNDITRAFVEKSYK